MIIALDTETYEQLPENNGLWTPVLDARKFALGCIVDSSNKERYFYDKEKMYEYIIELCDKENKRGHNVSIFAHNHQYDFYGYAGSHLLDNDIKVLCFNPFIAIYKDRNYFLDTMSFYRMALSEVGNMIQYKKMHMPESVTSLEELKPYLLNDTKMVMEAIMKVKNSLQVLGFKPKKLLTSGQVAMTTFISYCKKNDLLRKFMYFDKPRKRMQTPRTDYTRYTRLGLRGGRVEAFKSGEFENCYDIDIKAMYTSIMCNMDFPNLFTETVVDQNAMKSISEKELLNMIGVVKCTVKCPNLQLPFLPCKYNKVQLYPVNAEVRGVWTTIELRKALELGYKIKEKEWAIVYVKSEVNPLKSFLEKIYKVEKEDMTMKPVVKMIRNSIFGKFAQETRSFETKTILRKDSLTLMRDGWRFVRAFGNQYVLKKDTGLTLPPYYAPMVSAWVTALGRIRLFEDMSKIPYKDLIYCDTDGLIVRNNHLKKLKVGNDMGDWAIVSEGLPCMISGEKWYSIGDKVRASGIPKRDLTKDVLTSEEGITVKKMRTFKEALLEGDISTVGSFDETKVINRMLRKRDIQYPREIVEELIL